MHEILRKFYLSCILKHYSGLKDMWNFLALVNTKLDSFRDSYRS